MRSAGEVGLHAAVGPGDGVDYSTGLSGSPPLKARYIS